MTRTRLRVHLTKQDWKAIYDALGGGLDGSGVQVADEVRWRRVLSKIGVDGMAARARGVAPVRKRSTPRAPRV